MILFDVKIEGKTPLLCNAFTDIAAMKATEGTAPAVVGDRGTPKEQAAAVLYVGSNGKPMIPVTNLFRCIIDAGKFFKAGKSKVTTLKTSMIPAACSIDGLELPIIHKEPWTVDARPVRNPATGGRFMRFRPCFYDWALTFCLSLDETLISAKMLREIVDAGGSRIGLGDFRPDCKGLFGKFVVTLWKETKK